jgi:hypothetical protein
MRQHAPEFPTVSIALRIVFSIVFPLFAIVPAPAGFSLAVAKPCIVIPVAFAIADRLYFCLQPSLVGSGLHPFL